LLTIRGQAAPAVKTAYTRARVLCQQLGDTDEEVSVLLGLWRFHVVRAEYHLAQQLGEELLDVAQQREEAPIYVLAHYTVGFTYFCLGELRTARRHLEEGVARYTPSQRCYPTFRAGQDPGVACHVYAALTLWLLGYPDQALMHIHDALALAAGLNHPFTYSFARLAAALLGQLRQELQEIADHAEAGVNFSTEQGFSMWLAILMLFQGWAMTSLDQPKQGIMRMHKGLADWRACRAEFFVPYFLALLAEGYGVTAEPEEGLAILREAFSLVDNNGERWYEAELYRLRGQLLCNRLRTTWKRRNRASTRP
jgi:adenylate cyclase